MEQASEHESEQLWRSDLWAFFASTKNHWKELVGGSAVAIVIGVFATLGLDLPVWATYSTAISFAVCLAAFLAFRDERRGSVNKDSQIAELLEQLKAENRRPFIAVIQSECQSSEEYNRFVFRYENCGEGAVTDLNIIYVIQNKNMDGTPLANKVSSSNALFPSKVVDGDFVILKAEMENPFIISCHLDYKSLSSSTKYEQEFFWKWDGRGIAMQHLSLEEKLAYEQNNKDRDARAAQKRLQIQQPADQP